MLQRPFFRPAFLSPPFVAILSLLPVACGVTPRVVNAQDSRIRLDTVGFLPEREKRASIAAPCRAFTVRDAKTGKTVFHGTATAPARNPDTGEMLTVADFSALKQTGTYYIDAVGVGRSAPFRIAPDVYNDSLTTTMRGMTLWRCGIAVSGKRNGITFTQEKCHTEDALLDFVGGTGRRDATGGWHDAGDYNKYVVNAGVTVGMLFLAWEMFPDHLRKLKLDLPDAKAGMPDYLREIQWEMTWLLKMQVADGSVYHKVSTKNFGGFIPPDRETEPRYFVPWSSAATADFTALCAMAGRIYTPYDPAFARRCREAAQKSYRFLAAHPENQPANLRGFRTGEYQADDTGERLWAAAEMWETFGDAASLKNLELRARLVGGQFEDVFDWGKNRDLGLITYLLSKRPGKDPALQAQVRRSLISVADQLVKKRQQHGYERAFGTLYYWGANGAIARQVALLQVADRLAPNPKYAETSLAALHHLLGRNVYGRSFVTGIGFDPPRNPHDRRVTARPDKAAWPGYLIGGPWPRANSWKDDQSSYQTNEIAINWNGALIYALAGFAKP